MTTINNYNKSKFNEKSENDTFFNNNKVLNQNNVQQNTNNIKIQEKLEQVKAK
jgi:hypothetical protein